jgi:hypothetical protein
MYRNLFSFCLTAGVALGGATAGAQQPSLKERLVGTWTVVSQYTIAPDGKREELYGAKPIGRLTFDAGSRFSYIRSTQPGRNSPLATRTRARRKNTPRRCKAAKPISGRSQ